jgi:hypothetical protein
MALYLVDVFFGDRKSTHLPLAPGNVIDHEGADIHIARPGTGVASIELHERLKMSFRESPTDSPEIVPAALALMMPQYPVQSVEYRPHLPVGGVAGMDFDGLTGKVEVSSSCALRHLIVRIYVKEFGGTEELWLRVRIHIHHAAADTVELSPAGMGVRAGCMAKATLLASFSNVPANLTHEPDIEWSLVGGAPLFSGDPQDQSSWIEIESGNAIPNGFFVVGHDYIGSTSQVRATLPARLGGGQADVWVSHLAPWVDVPNVAHRGEEE